MRWHPVERPGYFGRRRDERIAALNRQYGAGNWRLAWRLAVPGFNHGTEGETFFGACRHLYEASYQRYLEQRPADVDFICSFGEVIDNAPSNVESGLDYMRQEAFSTHIQDIAIRNVLRLFGRWFEGPADRLLVVRSSDSNGHRFGPGRVPFAWPGWISKPSLAPRWAEPGSVEDAWQSNKWVEIMTAPPNPAVAEANRRANDTLYVPRYLRESR